MFDIDNLRVDPEKASGGTWVEYRGGSRLKVAKLNNKEYQAFRARKALEFSQMLQKEDEEADQKAEEITVEGLARHVLKDWEGFGSGDEEIEYSVEKAVELLSDPELSDFREDVVNLAANQSHFRPEAAAKAVKKAAAS